MVEFGHFPGCGTHILAPSFPDANSLLESAFVFQLPPHVAQLVDRIRSGTPVDAPREDQLKPHITLLYLGFQNAAFLSTLIRRLDEIAPRLSADVWCFRIGEFSSGDGTKNWHLTVEPRAVLRDMQQAVAEQCRALGWAVASRFMGDNYTPHITIWDRMSAPRQAVPPEVGKLLAGLTFRIQSPVVIGRRSVVGQCIAV